ncbi:hypothetical protein AYO49_04910 [Verrucomicrobiaceae bacterium SCGC AG-212-N21]|nr:hypothetical protein AYO49_04910 [Verrucomicrobiaceae bacterium SCGC AG-212-N21]
MAYVFLPPAIAACTASRGELIGGMVSSTGTAKIEAVQAVALMRDVCCGSSRSEAQHPACHA